MPRMARIAIPDVPHPAIPRGNRREDVFFDDEDRRRCLLLLSEDAQTLAPADAPRCAGRPRKGP